MAAHDLRGQIADALSPRGKAALRAALAEKGIALFSGVPDATSIVDLARTVGTVVDHRDSDASGVLPAHPENAGRYDRLRAERHR